MSELSCKCDDRTSTGMTLSSSWLLASAEGPKLMACITLQLIEGMSHTGYKTAGAAGQGGKQSR